MGKLRFFYLHIPSVKRGIRVKLNGKNLLIVGQNGSGKTSLLLKLDEALKTHFSHGYRHRDSYITSIRQYHQQIKDYPDHAQAYANQITSTRKSFRLVRGDNLLIIPTAEEISKEIQKSKFVVRLFTAHRKADIKSVAAAGGVVNDKKMYPRTTTTFKILSSILSI